MSSWGVVRSGPFEPPPYADQAARAAYAELKAVCVQPSSDLIDSDRLWSLVGPTNYDPMEFVTTHSESEVCAKIADLFWWEVNGDSVYEGLAIAGVCLVVLVALWAFWRLRYRVADAAIGGLASGVRAKRKAAASLGELGQKIRDRADNPPNPPGAS